MPTLETVNIGDVYPWEDEYGNQFLSRDYSTKENQRYVEELARSMRAKGVPDEPVQLSRDGGIFRIVSGNSRVRAMRLLGTKRFDAIILDDAEAKQAMRRAIETTVRTNTKKKYDAVEESRFVQQLAMFADDEYVAEAAGIEAEQVRKIRKARKTVGDDGDEMTIYRMCAIAEFSEDEKAVEMLTECPEREVDATLALLRSRRERAEREGTLVGTLEANGIPVVGSAAGMRVVAVVDSPEKVASLGDVPEGAVAAPHAVPGTFVVCAPAEEEATTEEIAESVGSANREAWAEQYRRGAERRMVFVREQIRKGSELKELHQFVEADDDRLRRDFSVHRFMEATDKVFHNSRGTDIPIGAVEVIAAFMALNEKPYGIRDYDGELDVRACRDYTDMIEVLEEEGYEPDVDERELYADAYALVYGEEQQC